MRFLILSDVHGNRHGLESVLQHAVGEYDQLICLGDVVGYGAHPNECCELLRGAGAQSLSGNHDAATLGLIDTEWFNPIAAAAVEWTRRTLSAENTAWLRGLPAQNEWPDEGFQAVHGSLREPWEEYITDAAIAGGTFARMGHPLCFFGHTHIATAFITRKRKSLWGALRGPAAASRIEEQRMREGGVLAIAPGRRYLVNPGSCGQPRDGNPLARYALYDTVRQCVEIRPVAYDAAAARAAIYAAGLPPMLGDRLLEGC